MASFFAEKILDIYTVSYFESKFLISKVVGNSLPEEAIID